MAKPAESAPSTSEIRFSVVILTYARDAILAQTLAALRAKAGLRTDYEVILVDNNDDDVDRASFLTSFAHSQWIPTGTNAGVSARNRGMEVAQGELIVLLDDDVIVETQGFLDVFESVFEANPEVGVVNVRKLDQTGVLLTECIPHTRKTLDTTKPFFTFRFIGGLVGVRRTLFREIGGFSADFFYGEEEREWSYRIIDAGWKLYFEPRIEAVETNNAGGRRPRAALRTEILGNRYIISFLYKPLPIVLFDFLVFTLYMAVKERGAVDVFSAVQRFTTWLIKPDRRPRRPLGAAAKAYVHACGGTIWR